MAFPLQEMWEIRVTKISQITGYRVQKKIWRFHEMRDVTKLQKCVCSSDFRNWFVNVVYTKESLLKLVPILLKLGPPSSVIFSLNSVSLRRFLKRFLNLYIFFYQGRKPRFALVNLDIGITGKNLEKLNTRKLGSSRNANLLK